MKKTLLVAGLLASWTCLSGCMPVVPVWLPDSSGFLYIDSHSHELVQVDLARQARRTITKADWLQTQGLPAISPDGKCVVLVRCRTISGKDGLSFRSAQLFINDLAGNQSVVSDEVKWSTDSAGKSDSNHDEVGAASWSPDGKKVLFATDDGPVVVYDVQQRAFRSYPGLRPAPEPFLLWISPFAPDGTGFLASRDRQMIRRDNGASDQPVRLVLVEWEGWEYNLRASPDLSSRFLDGLVLPSGWADEKAACTLPVDKSGASPPIGLLCLDARGGVLNTQDERGIPIVAEVCETSSCVDRSA